MVEIDGIIFLVEEQGLVGTLRITPRKEDLFHAAAQHMVEVLTRSQQGGKLCSVALAGGSTPRGLYQLLAHPPYVSQIAWERLRIFWGDERPVPPDHPDSNFRMAQEAFLSHVPIPPDQVFRIEGELAPEAAARRYERVLREEFGVSNGEVPCFDLILLGMGADGHTASLFPGTSAVAELNQLVAAPWVESQQTFRVTVTPPVLNAAKNVIFLVSGLDKAVVLQAVLEGPRVPDRYPAQVVHPTTDGHVWWLIDSAAASHLAEHTVIGS